MIDYFSEDSFGMNYIGKKQATTFNGFCGYHDTVLFRPIEEKNYIGEKEQEFLFAYRALAKEYCTKRHCYNFISTILTLINDHRITELESYFPEIKENSDIVHNLLSIYSPMIDGLDSEIRTLEKYKASMRINILNKDYHSIRTTVFRFPTESRIAVSSLVNIVYDLEGNRINDLKNPKGKRSPCFLTIFPQEGQTYILFSYFNKMKNDYGFISNQIVSMSIEEQKCIVSNIIVQYCEDVVFSPELWYSFSEKKQDSYLKLFKNTIRKKGKLEIDHALNIFEE